jgi:hypothetical protein
VLNVTTAAPATARPIVFKDAMIKNSPESSVYCETSVDTARHRWIGATDTMSVHGAMEISNTVKII